jgi:hypothetical protein
MPGHYGKNMGAKKMVKAKGKGGMRSTFGAAATAGEKKAAKGMSMKRKKRK